MDVEIAELLGISDTPCVDMGHKAGETRSVRAALMKPALRSKHRQSMMATLLNAANSFSGFRSLLPPGKGRFRWR